MGNVKENKGRVSKLVGKAAGIALTYVWPVAAGSYVAMSDVQGYNMDPTIKAAILGSPTAVNSILTAGVTSLIKYTGKIAGSEKVRESYRKKPEYKSNSEKIENTLDKIVEKTQGLSVTKKVGTTIFKTGTLTAFGYAATYFGSRFF
ncbi:hypothetical protein HOK51_08585 [Candidatus Woesearchaeota archaeon]|jgi:hypothetical protein|nr:hypothetical protein [Candidatus Woesearchaeota archaeon]MBT6519883.1 hypothetical protein [Candidatus Woesearchaeota archaeon]MBT7367175.1 hypothetical protein [Candidatus Woesearchaeota archaeon]